MLITLLKAYSIYKTVKTLKFTNLETAYQQFLILNTSEDFSLESVKIPLA